MGKIWKYTDMITKDISGRRNKGLKSSPPGLLALVPVLPASAMVIHYLCLYMTVCEGVCAAVNMCVSARVSIHDCDNA